jgi:hypothetical protein
MPIRIRQHSDKLASIVLAVSPLQPGASAF